MKRFIYYNVAVFLTALVVSGTADAQTKTGQNETANIAVLNLEAIRRNAKVVKNIREQVQNYRELFEAEIKKEEDALRNANQELARQRSILSPEAFVEERRKFEQRVVTIQRLVQQRKAELDQVQVKSMAQVETKLNEIVTQLAKDYNLSLVLRGSQTILAAQQLNITVKVLQILDTQMPSIVVPKPGQKK